MISQPASPPLPTPRRGVELRPWRADDAAWYIAARDDAVFAMTREQRDLSVEAFQAAIGPSPERTTALAIESDGETAGSLRVARSGEAAEISYWVAAPVRGRGVATTALMMGSDWAAALPGVRRLELVIHPDNIPSQRVAVKAGYASAGRVPAPHACCSDDGLVDLYVRLVVA